jgi:hypothetical protein
MMVLSLDWDIFAKAPAMTANRFRTDFLRSNALHELFLKLPREEICQVAREVQDRSQKEGLSYIDDDGVQRVIPLMLRPRIIDPIQRSYFHYVCLQINDALKRLPAMYLGDPHVRKLLPLGESEEAWLREAWGEGVPRFHTMITRLDANTDFTARDWREDFQFFEANSVGIGGLYYAAVAERIILDVVGPRLQEIEPELYLEPNSDTRALLLDEIRLHARSIRRPRCNIALLDDPDNVGGITEYPRLAEYFRARGHQAVLADPRELVCRGDELYYRDLGIDVCYRDVELKQCTAMEAKEGKPLVALRQAFRQNQMISSLAGDFDHKSCWEIFTDDEFANQFSAAQWQIFRRHVLWTRLIRETRTADDSGRVIDLVPYISRHRSELVIKPNREFGGTGVTLGVETAPSVWEQVLQEAVTHPCSYVVQRYAPVGEKEFPLVREDGTVTGENFYVTCGFIVSASEIGIVGRASKKSVVNIAQKGGLTTVLMILDQQFWQ